MRTDFARSRDHLAGGLADAGFAVLPAEGTYFLSIDLAASGIPLDDVTFCERAVREAGVAAIPVSALYAEEPARNVIRLCFARSEEHTSELPSLMRLSYAVFCLTQKTPPHQHTTH